MELKDKEQVTEYGDYLTKWLATIAALVEKSMPTVVALYNAIPHGKAGRWREPGKTPLFDIFCKLACIVLLTKLVELDGDVCLSFCTKGCCTGGCCTGGGR